MSRQHVYFTEKQGGIYILELDSAYEVLILDSGSVLAQTGGVKGMPLQTFKLLIFHITPIISASVAERRRRAAEHPLSRLQLNRSRSCLFFFSFLLFFCQAVRAPLRKTQLG